MRRYSAVTRLLYSPFNSGIFAVGGRCARHSTAAGTRAKAPWGYTSASFPCIVRLAAQARRWMAGQPVSPQDIVGRCYGNALSSLTRSVAGTVVRRTGSILMSSVLEHVLLHNLPAANEVTAGMCHSIDGFRSKGNRSREGE